MDYKGESYFETILQKLEEAEYFHQNIYGMNMEELDNLEAEFGCITFPAYDNGLKVPLGIMKPNELKLYLYLLRYGGGRKKDITDFLHISANKLDRIMDSAALIKKDGLKYSIMDKKVKNYIYLSEEELDKEIKRSDSLQKIAKTIIDNGSLALQAKKHLDEYGQGGMVQLPFVAAENKTCKGK